MGVAMEAMIKISVTTIIISRSEKPSAEWALWLSLGCIRWPIDVFSIGFWCGRIHRGANARNVCATRG